MILLMRLAQPAGLRGGQLRPHGCGVGYHGSTAVGCMIVDQVMASPHFIQACSSRIHTRKRMFTNTSEYCNDFNIGSVATISKLQRNKFVKWTQSYLVHTRYRHE